MNLPQPWQFLISQKEKTVGVFRITGLVIAIARLLSGSISAQAQQPPEFSDVSVTPTNTVRMVTLPVQPNPDAYVLESADTPAGPWYKETESLRNNAAGGSEYITPRKTYDGQKYYRLAPLSVSPSTPFIRFIAPNSSVRTNQSVSLLGANFNPSIAGNIVKFELLNQSFIVTVTSATTNCLTVTVPANLPTTNTGFGLLYRVTVTTTNGVSNGVGCSVYPTTLINFAVRPAQLYVIQPPGSGKDTMVVGGGTPPYTVLPLTAFESNFASVTINGPVITVASINTNMTFGNVNVRVRDSSVVTNQVTVNATIEKAPMNQSASYFFHTRQAGTAPGFTTTITIRPPTLMLEKIEMLFTNVTVELDQLTQGSIIGLFRTFYSSSTYGFEHLVVTDVSGGIAKFDMITYTTNGIMQIGRGQLIKNPPALVLNITDQQAAAVPPTSFDEELIVADSIFRLPASSGQPFSVATVFTSVSASEDKYLPLKYTVSTNNFITTNTVLTAPLIQRLVPVQGEIGCNVRIIGTNFDLNPANNVVTFTGLDGTRVVAPNTLKSNNELIVSVPRDAITGPVRVEVAGKVSNDFTFFARYHADALLVFLNDKITNNVPAPLRIVHQQVIDDKETIGEVPIGKITATIDQGRLNVTNLVVNQQVGTNSIVNFYTGQRGTNFLVYKGQDPQATNRYMFHLVSSVGSSTALTIIYASDDQDGSGVTFEVQGGLLPINAGIMYDHAFTSPIYRPPAVGGSQVVIKVDAMSQQWNSVGGTEMHVIRNSSQQVQ